MSGDDHIIHCNGCYSDTGVVKDCPCLSSVHCQKCWGCKERESYERVERRLADDF